MIDLTKDSKDMEYRRHVITQIVEAYEKEHPHSAADAAESARGMRRTRANPFAVSDKSAYADMPFQWGFRLPGGMMRMFDAFLSNPVAFHEEEEYRWFMKTFKRYRIPEKF